MLQGTTAPRNPKEITHGCTEVHKLTSKRRLRGRVTAAASLCMHSQYAGLTVLSHRLTSKMHIRPAPTVP